MSREITKTTRRIESPSSTFAITLTREAHGPDLWALIVDGKIVYLQNPTEDYDEFLVKANEHFLSA